MNGTSTGSFQHSQSGDKKYRIKNKILIEPKMFYSDAFIELSASAIRTLMRCLQKRKWAKVKFNGIKQIVYSNEEFIFPYAEAAFLKIGTTQFWKNIQILIKKGFLDLAYQGGWYQKNEREKDYNRYKLSDRWRQYGTEDFKEVKKEKVLNPEYYILKNKTRATSQKRNEHLHKGEVDNTIQENCRLLQCEVEEKQQKDHRKVDNAI